MHIKRSLGHQAGTHLPPTNGWEAFSFWAEICVTSPMQYAFFLKYRTTNLLCESNFAKPFPLSPHNSAKMRIPAPTDQSPPRRKNQIPSHR